MEKTEIKKVPILVEKKLMQEYQKENYQNQNLFLCDEINQKKKIKKRRGKSSQSKYSNAKIKAGNFITNPPYQRLNKNDHLNISFVIDCFSFIIKNINPFSLERKFTS